MKRIKYFKIITILIWATIAKFNLLAQQKKIVEEVNRYPLTEDSKTSNDLKKGEFFKDIFVSERFFPGTERAYQIYIPDGLDRTKEVPIMVFQDGMKYEANHVLDHLVAKKEIPPMIGIFIAPGIVKAVDEKQAQQRYQRSYEYDSVSPLYGQFLIEEILPFIEKKHQLKFSKNPNDCAIAGSSTGGICALNVAWQHNHRFRRVYTSVGTYVGLRGGDTLASWMRLQEPRALRVFLQDGENDLNIYAGDWWMQNLLMERALQWCGYEVNHAWGTEGHKNFQAAQIFPDVMRWLWKDYPAEVKPPNAEKSQGAWKELLAEGSAWHKINNINNAKLFVDQQEQVWAVANQQLIKMNADQKWQKISEINDGVEILYVVNADEVWIKKDQQLLKTDSLLKNTQFLLKGNVNTIVKDSKGYTYISVADQKSLIVLDAKDKEVQRHHFEFSPTMLGLRADQSELILGREDQQMVWLAQIQSNQELKYATPFFHLHRQEGLSGGATHVVSLENGYTLLLSDMGIQYMDQPGRTHLILNNPEQKAIQSMVMVKNKLYVSDENGVYLRDLLINGLNSMLPPVKPSKPSL
jgi:enterochelin esterase-like enzyme